MTDGKVFHKALNNAIENGFKGRRVSVKYPDYNEKDLVYSRNIELCNSAISLGIYQGIIFSHEFAKAFWGEKTYCDIEFSLKRRTNIDEDKIDSFGIIQDWQYHLQQMVIKKEPIKYLINFI